MADGAYYKGLEERFESYESLLYEMIKPREANPALKGRSDNLLSLFQRSLKNVLELEFQLDANDDGSVSIDEFMAGLAKLHLPGLNGGHGDDDQMDLPPIVTTS